MLCGSSQCWTEKKLIRAELLWNFRRRIIVATLRAHFYEERQRVSHSLTRGRSTMIDTMHDTWMCLLATSTLQPFRFVSIASNHIMSVEWLWSMSMGKRQQRAG